MSPRRRTFRGANRIRGTEAKELQDCRGLCRMLLKRLIGISCPRSVENRQKDKEKQKMCEANDAFDYRRAFHAV